MDGDEAMIPDDAMAIGGTITQQDEVRTQGRGMRCRSVVELGPQTHFGSPPRPALATFFETARTRCGVGVCGVCALGRERWGKETTTAFCPGDGVCVSRPCSQDVGTGGVAPTGSAVPLPAGAATANDAAADAVWPRTRFRCVCGRLLRVGGSSDRAGLWDGMSGE